MSHSFIPDFEASLKNLEDMVNALEKGDLSLEDSLKTFEEGIKLTQTCQKALTEAEQRIEQLKPQPRVNHETTDLNHSHDS